MKHAKKYELNFLAGLDQREDRLRDRGYWTPKVGILIDAMRYWTVQSCTNIWAANSYKTAEKTLDRYLWDRFGIEIVDSF